MIALLIISNSDFKLKFKASVTWNPVVAMHATIIFSDIPDWHSSVCLNSEHSYIMKREDVMEMYDQSPIRNLRNIKTPSLFIIGGEDRRCPSQQSLYCWRGLKERNMKANLHLYPKDGHAISSTEGHIDAVMNISSWWISHL